MQSSAKALLWISLVFVVGSVCGGLAAIRLDRLLTSPPQAEIEPPLAPIVDAPPEPGQVEGGEIPSPPQLPPPDRSRPAGPAGRPSDNGMRVVERMIRQLNLNQEQRGQVRQIMQRSRRRQLQAAQELRLKMSQLRRHTFDDIVDVLTPAQAVRFRNMVQRFNRFRRDRRPGAATDRARPVN